MRSLLAVALGGLVGCGAILGYEPLSFDGESETGDGAPNVDGTVTGDGQAGDGAIADGGISGEAAASDGSTPELAFCNSSGPPDANIVCDDFDTDRVLYNHLVPLVGSPYGTIEIQSSAAISPPNALVLDIFATSDAGVGLGLYGNLPVAGSSDTITCQFSWRVDNQPSGASDDPIDLFRVTLNNAAGPPYPTVRLLQWPDRTVGYQIGDFAAAPGAPQSTGKTAKVGAFSTAAIEIQLAAHEVRMTIDGDGSFPPQALVITQPTNALVLSLGSIDVRSTPWTVRFDNFLCQ